MGYSAKQSYMIALPKKLKNWNLKGPDIRLISLDRITDGCLVNECGWLPPCMWLYFCFVQFILHTSAKKCVNKCSCNEFGQTYIITSASSDHLYTKVSLLLTNNVMATHTFVSVPWSDYDNLLSIHMWPCITNLS